MLLPQNARWFVKGRCRSLVLVLILTLMILISCVIYNMIRYLYAPPSIEALLRRVRPNASELADTDPWFYERRRNTSMLEDMNALGWKTEEMSMRHNREEMSTDTKDMIVPNVVHYVWLGTDLDFTFLHYLSFLSVHRFIRPQFIFVYGEQGPSGRWWEQTLHDVDNIYHVFKVTPLVAPSGRIFRYKAHASDLLRTQIICEFGGIYLDTDVIVLKSFNALRIYPTVMGRETDHGICNGIIISVKGAPFVRMLLEQYKDYAGSWEQWEYRSVLVPHILAAEFPSLIHVEETRLHRPNWDEISRIYDDDNLYDWRDNFSVHLWLRMQRKRDRSRLVDVEEGGAEQINCLPSTLGEIARFVTYGVSNLRC